MSEVMKSVLDLLQQDFFYFSIIQVLSFLSVGVPLGRLMVHKNLGLFSDSLSHSLIPGLAVAVYFFGLRSASLAIGAMTWGLMVSLLFSLLGGLSAKNRDSLLVVISLAGLSVGLLLNQLFNLHLDLTHMLFGSPLLTTVADLVRSLVLNIVLLLVAIRHWKKLELFCVDAEFARIKFGEFKMNFIFTFLSSALVISGFEIFGVLLTTGLLILPSVLFERRGASILNQSFWALLGTFVIAVLSFIASALLNLTFSSVFIASLAGLTLIRWLVAKILKQSGIATSFMLIFALILAYGFAPSAQASKDAPATGSAEATRKDSRAVVIVSFSVLEDITKQLVAVDSNSGSKDKANAEVIEVVSLTDRQEEVHHFDPKPMTLQKMREAQLFIYNGLGLEPWIEKIKPHLSAQLQMSCASVGIATIEMKMARGSYIDPHAWNSPDLAVIYVKNIRAALVQKWPSLKKTVDKNADQLIRRLKKMDDLYLKKFASVPEGLRVVLSTHDGLAYVGRRYALKILSPWESAHQADVKPAQLTKLKSEIKKYNLKYMFTENGPQKIAAEKMAEKINLKLGPELYLDGLSLVKGPAANFEAMLDYNLTELHRSMKSSDPL